MRSAFAQVSQPSKASREPCRRLGNSEPEAREPAVESTHTTQHVSHNQASARAPTCLGARQSGPCLSRAGRAARTRATREQSRLRLLAPRRAILPARGADVYRVRAGAVAASHAASPTRSRGRRPARAGSHAKTARSRVATRGPGPRVTHCNPPRLSQSVSCHTAGSYKEASL